MIDLPRICDRVIQWGLFALIAFTPLAFGTVEPWSVAAMEWGIVTLGLVYGLGRLCSEGPRRRLRGSGVEAPLMAFVLLCALQTAPLPLSWLKVISPGSFRMYEKVDFPAVAAETRPAAEQAPAGDALLHPNYPTRRPVSMTPSRTWDRLCLLTSLALLFLVASWWADRREKIVFVLQTVTFIGFLVAVEGMVQFLTWNGRIYWFRKVPPSSPFGPFVNHNHFAGYVEMVIPVAISLTFYYLSSGAGRGLARGDQGRWGKGGLALFAAAVLLTTLFLSLSRGGILSATASGLLLFVLLWRRDGSRWLARSIAVALPALVVALVVWVGGDAVRHQIGTYRKLESEASFRSRVVVWESLLRHQPEFLWLGSGLGAFEDSYAPFAPAGSAKRWDRAHNDYLQLLWETGLVGSLLFLVGGAIFVRRYWWPALSNRTHELVVFRVAIAVALASIALHSFVDFNLQIGANGFLFALLAGLLVALQRASEEDGLRAVPLPSETRL